MGTLTSQKSIVFVDDKRENAVSFSAEGVAFDGNGPHHVFADDKRENAVSSSLTGPQDSQTLRLAEAEGVAFDGNEKHYGRGNFERLALLIVLNASSRTDENLDTKIAHEMKCNWFKDTQRLSRDRTSAGGVMGKEALVRKMLMPYVTGAGSGRERIKWPRRFCKECLR